jgi:hypothetical protein
MQNEGNQQEYNPLLTSAPSNADQKKSTAHDLSLDVKQSSASEPPKVERIAGPPSRKSTGPRTPQGKRRSRLNALKHGLFSKNVLLQHESQADYLKLLNGLQDQYEPREPMESADVENLAILLWRKRRYFGAETAEISERIAFEAGDSVGKQQAEAWELSRSAIASGGLLLHCYNPFVAREIKEIYLQLRLMVTTETFMGNFAHILIKRLYGEDQDGCAPDIFGLLCEMYPNNAGLGKIEDNQLCDTVVKEKLVALLDAKIEGITELEETLETEKLKRTLFKRFAAVIPGEEASDRLMRYETHLSREIDRILNRLERLQRMRKGQPLPPQVDVKIS